jgi:hypothetical protein
MRVVARFVGIAFSAVALVALAGAGAGCGGGAGGSTAAGEWGLVTTAQVSGDKPVKVSLGDYPLGDRVRLAWDLSGPKNPPVNLTFRVADMRKGGGYSYSVTPASEGHAIALKDEQGIVLRVIPGEYRIYFSQRFAPARGPGYDAKLRVYTMWIKP